MYTTTELEENSKMVKASTDSFEEIWASVVSRYLATLCDSDRVSAALELERMLKEITSVDDSAALSGFKLLFNTNKVNERSGVLEALDTRQLQRLVDDVFSALQARKVGVVLLSEFLARIWLSTRLLPSEVKMNGIKTASLYPFATTPTSNVFEGLMSDGTRVAMKTCRQSQSQPASVEHIKRFFFEALVSSTTSHSNILPSLGLYIDPSPNVYLVSKFQKHGSLPQYLFRNPAVPKLPMLVQVAAALSYLHSQDPPILHGDIRGMNVLVDDFGKPLLMDMGYSLVMDPVTSTFSPDAHHFVGNPRWTPWEKVAPTEFPLTLKADSFSFASFMLEIFSGDVPYRYLSSDSAVIVEFLVRKKLPRRPDNPQLTDPLWNLMTKCWTINPILRPSMKEIHRELVSLLRVS